MKALFALLGLLLVSSNVWAEISVTLSVDRSKVSTDDEISLSLTIAGTRQAGQPQIQGLDNFQVQSQGSSSQVQILNQSMSVQTVFQYALYPKKIGKFSLGPAKITVNGTAYESNVVSITVVKGGSQTASGNKESPYYIVTEVDTKSPYVNQQIVFTFRLFTRVEIVEAQLQTPEFDGFWKESLGDQKTYNKMVDGVRYRVTEIKTALFPTAEGTVEIPPTTLVGAAVMPRKRQRRRSFFDEFFEGQRAKRIRLRSQPITLNVKALPTSKPKGFVGLVGTLRSNAKFSKSVLAVGESTTLTLTVQGDGNIRDIQVPLARSKQFKVYEDDPTVAVTAQGDRVLGSKVFKWAIVPLEEGELNLDLPKLAYFDVPTKSYKEIEWGVPPLSVSPGSGESLGHMSANQGSKKRGIKVEATDLAPLKRDLASLRPDSPRLFSLWLFWFSLLGMPLIYLGASVGYRRHRNLSQDIAYQRRGKAYREFRQGWQKLSENGAFYEQASAILRSYIGNKLNVEGRALTAQEAKGRLGEAKAKEQTVEQVVQFLSLCERGQYGGQSGESSSKQKLKAELGTLVQQLEKEVRA